MITQEYIDNMQMNVNRMIAELQTIDPERAKSESMEALIRMGVLDENGNLKENIVTGGYLDGGSDMCAALEKKYKEKEITGAIGILRDYGESDDIILERIIQKYNVTEEYVISLLDPKEVNYERATGDQL